MPDGWDDEELLAALGEAVKARQAVPEWFVETGKNAYDSDSDADRGVAAAVRSEAASIRALTFTSARLSIELEVASDSLVGQIIPPQAGTLEVYTTGGVTSSPVDEMGWFAVTPIPATPFRLRCRTEDGTDVLTGWITL